ncbi:MAG: hypothetical protein JW857_03000 [Bacteroidales bacterium]|nr:hypothetical protein [Bacteroidales bacterium]
MNKDNKIEAKISAHVNRSKNAGFTSPPAGYFDNFTANLPIEEKKKTKTISFKLAQNNWIRLISLAVAALLLLALWIFVFDADINKDARIDFTIEELMAINDFQNYDEDIIYSELASVTDVNSLYNDPDVDALLDYSNISTDEIIELYSTEDLK